jgi:hypothetical protein
VGVVEPAQHRARDHRPGRGTGVTAARTNSIVRLTTVGEARAFPIPTADSVPVGITAGPDGALWVTLIDANRIGRVQLRSPARGAAAPPPVGLPRTGHSAGHAGTGLVLGGLAAAAFGAAVWPRATTRG